MKPPRPSKVLSARVSNSRTRHKVETVAPAEDSSSAAIKPFTFVSQTKRLTVVVCEASIARSRYHLAEDFLPKIEHCLEKLSDEQIWWRANEQSNSIGNLVMHLCGNARQWIVCGIGEGTDKRDRDGEFAQREIVPRDELL